MAIVVAIEFSFCKVLRCSKTQWYCGGYGFILFFQLHQRIIRMFLMFSSTSSKCCWIDPRVCCACAANSLSEIPWRFFETSQFYGHLPLQYHEHYIINIISLTYITNYWHVLRQLQLTSYSISSIMSHPFLVKSSNQSPYNCCGVAIHPKLSKEMSMFLNSLSHPPGLDQVDLHF